MEPEKHFSDEIDKFQRYSSSLYRLVFKDTEEYRKELSGIIDELNSLEYASKIAREEVAGRLLGQCCHLVPLKDDLLVAKFAQLVVNLVSRQQLILNQNLPAVVEYFIQALRSCQPWVYPDLLRALAALVYENSGQLAKFHSCLLDEGGLLLVLIASKDEEVCRGALQCMENITARSCPDVYLSEAHQTICYEQFLLVLHSQRPPRMDEVCHCRILLSALRGIQNMLVAMKGCLPQRMGPLLAAIKVYMLHGLPGQPTDVPESLFPTAMSQYDPTPEVPEERKPSSEVSLRPALTKSTASPHGKKTRKKKAKPRPRERREESNTAVASEMEQLNISNQVSHSADSTPVKGTPGSSATTEAAAALLPPWAVSASSESEFSDTEGGQASKLRSYMARVRQCTLNCFHALIKVTNKREMFGYWNAFLPDSSYTVGPPQGQTLFTSIIKDPSPKARAGSLAVLTALFEGCKRFLMAAEESDIRQHAFTPFSVTLGHMVKEIHRCLLLALVSETSPLALTQVIKCLGTLVANVTYERLRPGLLTRVVRQVKQYLSHRDPNIRVACLTCLGSVVSVSTPLMEVWQLLQASPRHSNQRTLSQGSQGSGLQPRLTPDLPAAAESGYQSGAGLITPPSTPNPSTPPVHSGSLTPTGSDPMQSTSWLVKHCIHNVAAHLLEDKATTESVERNMQPLPVRLESLQLLAQLTKGYFSIVRPCLPLICELVQCCLHDKDSSVQLHGAKLLEEVGFLMLQQLQPLSELPPPQDASLTVTQAVEFWLPLLQAPLPLVLQKQTNHAVRSTACDCLADIGPHTFEQLPLDKRLLCITLLLGLSSDEDSHVRAASVRALGVYVLYPCLREDVSFVADVANAIITALDENNLGVKVKAAWSLGNLSDALVMNKEAQDQAFMDDLADMLLLKLIECSIHSSQDNDKVKSNAVRALGNLLRYLPQRSYGNSRFSHVVDLGIQALIKNVKTGTMKVRWNACYATSNMFRNELLLLGTAAWRDEMHTALATVVCDCKNFKVRINAAMALSVPATRGCYGSTEQFAAIWRALGACLGGTSETVTDFADYKYRDSLCEQVCIALIHLGTLVELADIIPVHQALLPIISDLPDYIAKACQRAKPEQGITRLPLVAANLTKISACDMTLDETEALDVLTTVFTQAVEDPGMRTDHSSHVTTAFRQTYD